MNAWRRLQFNGNIVNDKYLIYFPGRLRARISPRQRAHVAINVKTFGRRELKSSRILLLYRRRRRPIRLLIIPTCTLAFEI